LTAKDKNLENTVIESNNMNVILKNTSAPGASKSLNDAEIALIDVDKEMNKLMISK
jgi:hypothetical protein